MLGCAVQRRLLRSAGAPGRPRLDGSTGRRKRLAKGRYLSPLRLLNGTNVFIASLARIGEDASSLGELAT